MLLTRTPRASNSNNLSPNTHHPGTSETHLSRIYSPQRLLNHQTRLPQLTNLNSKSGPCTLVIPGSRLSKRGRGNNSCTSTFRRCTTHNTLHTRYTPSVIY